jgi:hypothetical protein
MYKEEMDEVDREAEPSTSQYGEAMFWWLQSSKVL